MIINTVTVSLDRQLPLSIVTAKQGDTGRSVVIKVETEYETYDIETATAKIYIKKPDGTKIYNTCINNGDGTFIVALTNQALAVKGDAQAELQLTSTENPSEWISTPVFILRVLPSYIDDTAIESSNEFDALHAALFTVGALGIVSPVALDGDYVEEREALGFTRAGALANLTLRLSTTAALTSGTEYVIASGVPAPLSDVVFDVEMLDSNDDIVTVGHAWISSGDDSLHFVPASSMASGDDLDISVTYMVSGTSGQQPGGGGLSEEVKVALLQLFEHVAYADDDGQTYYDALYNALYPPASLSSISAVFNQGGATITTNDSLDVLRQYLTVTAHYTDSTSEVVNDYVLSGSLTAGTSTITATYGGKSDTFSVTVTSITMIADWDFSTSLVDSVNGHTFTTDSGSSGTVARDSDGLKFTATNGAMGGNAVCSTVALSAGDIVEIELDTTSNMTGNSGIKGPQHGYGNGALVQIQSPDILVAGWRGSNDKYFAYYSGGWRDVLSVTDPDAFNGKTFKMVVESNNNISIYNDDTLVGTVATTSATYTGLILGNTNASATQTYANMTVKRVKIYHY